MSAPAVLLLNASYEPLRTISYQRAIVLIVQERAELVTSVDGKEIRSPSKSFPWPSVVRLLEFVKIPFRKKKIPITKKNILLRDGYECCYCTKRRADSVDHIIPKSRGGENTWQNLVASCKPCNVKKNNRTPKEANMKMRFQPYEPLDHGRLSLGIPQHKDWEEWLSW
jgi:5-methylcytosine-specific restriction endonuclease McrA